MATSNTQVFSGQSNYDICLEVYGTLDNFVSLMIENNVTGSDSIPNSVYSYNPTLNNINSNFIGNIYSTKS